MKKTLVAATALSVSASAAVAAGVERSNQSVGVLFEEGRYLEFGFIAGDPSVSGTLGPFESGDMTESFFNFGGAYKADINEEWSYAVIYNQPWGADVAYPFVSYPFAGSTAVLESHALTGLLQYNLPSNVSFYGGVRAQSLDADATVNAVGSFEGYVAQGERDYAFGYVLGTAYERPDIALRVSLTYNSEINHELETVETLASPVSIAGLESTTEITTPRSLHLEFQTGVAEDTLLFGGIRWVEWTEFNISPEFYSSPALANAPLVSYEDDRITWTLGLGRRLNDQWSILGSVVYEETTGSLTGNLGPTDGVLGATLGAVYTTGNTEVTAGISYFDIGDATTTAAAEFEDNEAVGFGLRVGYSF